MTSRCAETHLLTESQCVKGCEAFDREAMRHSLGLKRLLVTSWKRLVVLDQKNLRNSSQNSHWNPLRTTSIPFAPSTLIPLKHNLNYILNPPRTWMCSHFSFAVQSCCPAQVMTCDGSNPRPKSYQMSKSVSEFGIGTDHKL